MLFEVIRPRPCFRLISTLVVVSAPIPGSGRIVDTLLMSIEVVRGGKPIALAIRSFAGVWLRMSRLMLPRNGLSVKKCLGGMADLLQFGFGLNWFIALRADKGACCWASGKIIVRAGRRWLAPGLSAIFQAALIRSVGVCEVRQ